jgi:nucleoside-diphosphate-sugar epimerase
MAIARLFENRAAAIDADKPPLLSCFQVAQTTRDVRYSSRRAREELGWTPEVGLSEGLTRTFAPEMPRD